jgi:hypothetical protein
MHGKRLLWLPAGAGLAFLVFAACAPVAPPESSPGGPERPPAEENPAPVEPLGLRTGGPDLLRDRIELAIKNVRQRDLLTTYGFWTVFHGILGMGPGTTLLDARTKKRVNAIDYVCSGGKVRGMDFVPTPWGVDVTSASSPEVVFVSQGHQDQFIAEMAQWGMTPDRAFTVRGKTYHFSDFINQSKMRASTKPGPDGKKQELSWTILIVGQYLGTDAAWTNQDGEKLRLEDLLRYELGEPMTTSACGGTHRLFDLSWVYQLHLKRGGKTEGVWKRVAENAAHYQMLARKLRNPDGSFSTDFFNGPGNVADAQRRINTSGHIFEWLSLSLPDAELRAGWVEDAANALAQMILNIANQDMEGGTLYHAVHGLIIYHARVYNRAELDRDLSFLPLPPAGRPVAAAAR